MNASIFITAQQNIYEQALAEIKAGQKRSHWMWFIFPQLRGLGSSPMAHKYGIENLAQAKAYLQNKVLEARLKEMCRALLAQPVSNVSAVFAYPDDLKLHSCMTLFAVADAEENNIFKQVVQKFYNGNMDKKTLALLSQRF